LPRPLTLGVRQLPRESTGQRSTDATAKIILKEPLAPLHVNREGGNRQSRQWYAAIFVAFA
jgi:hypothetical protein